MQQVRLLEEEVKRLKLDLAKYSDSDNLNAYSQINFNQDCSLEVQNKEFDVLKGLICYNERMSKYERQIEDILQLRTFLVSNKDKKIEELETKQKDMMVRNASINKTLKSENKKNQEKLSK